MESSGPAPAADTTVDVELDVGASIKLALWLEARHSHMAQTWYPS